MESTAPEGVQSSSSERRRSSQRSRPWDEPAAGRRPSAYEHYKKLVHDFENLEEDLEQTRLAQEQYEAQLNQHKSKVEAHEKQRREQEHAAWIRERERQVETICKHQSAVDALKQEHAALEEEEIRLQAELEVLHEIQQQENESEAKRISDLVHKRPSLLEKELTKGQMDIEFLTQIVTTSKRKNANTTEDGSSLHALVGTIQQRRQDAFREAAAQFEERLHSFEAEKEALKKKAEEIEWKKQRALKILSTNQQQVIQGFFTTPRAAIQEANPPLPSLAFSEILDGIKQPSGDAVSRLQDFEYTKQSARRQLGQALADAERNLECGPKKLEQLEQRLQDRQQDALRLKLPSARSSGAAESGYDGRWGVETYRQDQYGLVYFVRGMVFEWMEKAVEIAQKQPERALLEMEIQRHKATRQVLERVDEKQRGVNCAALVALEIECEVVQEVIQSIHRELTYSASRVRDVILQEIKQSCFPAAQSAKAVGQRPAPTLRWGLFHAAFDELKLLHSTKQPPLITARPRRLIMQSAKAVAATPSEDQAVASTTSSSPKKRFGLFTGGQKPKPLDANQVKSSSSTAPTPTAATTADQLNGWRPQDPIPVQVVANDIPTTSDAGGRDLDRQAIQLAEQTLWQSQITILAKSFRSLATCGFVSCVQLSNDGRLLSVGTLYDEIVVYSLLVGVETIAVPIRMVSASKAAGLNGNTSSATRRITRLSFSGCGRRLLAYNQFKATTLWSIVSPTTTASHSADCFTAEGEKAKPTPLSLIATLDPVELFQEPATESEVLADAAPVAAARLQSAEPLAISAFNFFPSVTLTGEQPFVLVGASNGDILKVLASSKLPRAKEDSVPKLILLGSVCEAAFDLPRPQDTELQWLKPPHSEPMCPCNRELFRQAHRQSVLFVSSIPTTASSLTPSSNTESPKPRLVSVDQSGRVALWIYSRDHFSGLGWFTPQYICELDLSARSSTSGASTINKGEILQIQLTPDRKRLVLMVYYAGAVPQASKTPTSIGHISRNRLRFLQLDLSTNELTSVVSVHLEIDFTGDIPPRFVLLSIPTPKLTPRLVSAASGHAWKSCFLVLLMNNALHVYSLITGVQCLPPIPLQAVSTGQSKARSKAKEPMLLFNSIAATSILPPTASDRVRTVAKIAVAGEQHKEIRVLHLNVSTTS